MKSILYSHTLHAFASLPRLILSPLVSGSLLLSLTYYPETVRDVLDPIIRALPARLRRITLNLTVAKSVLKVFFGLGLLRQVNQALNIMASNSWRLLAASGWDWSNEIAVVTGGSSGIGKDIVEKLVALGMRVAVLDLQEPPKAMQANDRIGFYHCDVTSVESVRAAAEAVRREIGHPSILVNNAGVARPAPILKTSEEALRTTFGVNCMALWFTTQEFLPRMIQLDKGHVVTVASIASFVALATAADYSATKAGALAFHEALASEIKHYYKSPKILTTVVHPNFVNTPLIEDYSSRLQDRGVRLLTSDQVADKIVSQIHSRRGGQLIIPDTSSAISGIRGWPTWLQEILRDVIGRGSVQR